jgi:hypothetical protein
MSGWLELELRGMHYQPTRLLVLFHVYRTEQVVHIVQLAPVLGILELLECALGVKTARAQVAPNVVRNQPRGHVREHKSLQERFIVMAGLGAAVWSFGRVVAVLLYNLFEALERFLLVVRKMAVVSRGVLERLGAR